MTVACPECGRDLVYSGEPPRFCGYCGKPLGESRQSSARAEESSGSVHEDRTEIGSGHTPTELHAAATMAHAPPPTPLPNRSLPEVVGGYRLVKLLGRGGMGSVYEADESSFGRKVALKLVSPEIVATDEAIERFRLEGRLASAITHPRCVFVLNADQDAGRPYIAMELMPGTTLADLVKRDGPLAVEDAIGKILDVIEGLGEAHRLGVIHRDVKPSNCFLDSEGRVKIGDFGLSKSLVTSSELTRTGSFLGTPLYASPEQIKAEPLDPRSDMYSVAATLYYLLVGRAPFQGGDAAATLARIVADPPPSMRMFRPELPAELERVVLRALDRNRDKRFRDLAEFHAALVSFLPTRLTVAGLSLRVAAFLIDVNLSKFVALALLNIVTFGLFKEANVNIWASMELSAFLDFGISLLSFGLIEPLWGASPAKWLLRLRVRDKGFGPAKPSQILRRNVIFYLIGSLPWELFVLGFAQMRGSAWLSPLLGGVRLVCIGILAFPMRASNGFRGLHDLWTDTRVVSLPRIERRKAPTEARRKIGRERGVTRPVGVLQSVGPFKVRGAVRWEPNRKVLAGEDSALGREAWIVLRPSSSHPPDVARRSLARPTRPRWLTGGEQREGRWDAFVAPAGCPLVDLAGPKGLPWHDARPILEDLADEVVAASADGTLPEGLALDLVWVEPDGRTQIVDPLGIVDEARDQSKPADQESRGLDLIRLAAAVALEGGRRRGGDLATPIRAPVPIHARKILDLLMDRKKGYDSIEALRANLRDTREKPTAVTRMMRGTHLGVQAALLLIGLYFLCLIAYAFASRRFEVFFPEGPAERLSVSSGRELLGTVIMIAIPLAWIIWATVFRGGLSLPLVGLSLVGNEGKPASRWRAGLRALLVWAPLAAIWTLAIWLREWLSAWPDVALGVYGIGVVYLLVLIPWALVRPERGFHDRLAGTWIVPR